MMNRRVPILIVLVFSLSKLSATTYYYQIAQGSITTASHWNTMRNGAGTNAGNFTTAGDVFVFQAGQNAQLTGTWTFGAAGSVMQIESGATFQADATINMHAAATLQVDNLGTYIHNSTNNGAFNGLESFAPNSTVKIWKFASSTPITTNITLPYGNLEIAVTSSVSGWNQAWNGSIYLCAGNFTINDFQGQPFQCTATGTAVIRIDSSFTIAAGSSTNNFDLATSTGSCTFNIGGNFTQTGGTINLTSVSPLSFGQFNFVKNGLQTFLRTGGTIAAKKIHFTVKSTSILDMGTSIINSTTGDFTLESGGGLRMGLSTGITTTTLSGHVQNTGTGVRNYSMGGYYTYNGVLAQGTGDGLPSTVAGLTINNSAGLTLSGATTTITDSLGLSLGRIKTDASHLLILASTAKVKSPVNVYGDLNEGYQLSYVSGPMSVQKNSLTLMTLPIGKDTSTGSFFAPVKLTPFNNTTKTYTAEYFPKAHFDYTNVDPAYAHHVSSIEFWNISCNISASPDKDAFVGLSWRPTSQVGIPGGTANDSTRAWDSLIVAHYFSNPTLKWGRDGAPLQNNDTIRLASNLSYGYITTRVQNAVTSSFTLGSRSAIKILPVKLLKWFASRQNDKVLLSWVTSEEKSVAKYEVQRSTDGINFTTIATKQAVASLSEHNYFIFDHSPYSGMNYYRLMIKDNLDKATFSGVIAFNFSKSVQLAIYPNPAVNFLIAYHGSLPVSSSYAVYSSNGKRVISGRIKDHSTTTRVDVSTLPHGSYIFETTNSKATKGLQFIKQ